MTRAEMAAVMDRVFDECMALRDAGQKEYAHDEDNAFANFERVAKDLGISREKVLWIFAMKHRDGIVAHINGYTSQREDVRGRINDLIVYLCLLRAMLDENDELTSLRSRHGQHQKFIENYGVMPPVQSALQADRQEREDALVPHAGMKL